MYHHHDHHHLFVAGFRDASWMGVVKASGDERVAAKASGSIRIRGVGGHVSATYLGSSRMGAAGGKGRPASDTVKVPSMLAQLSLRV